MTKARRLTAAFLCTTTFAGLTGWVAYRADAQVIRRVVKPINADGEDNSPATSAITLPTERKAQQVMNAARQLVLEQEWGQAVKALQSLLDTPNDGFVEVRREATTAGGKATSQWVSMKSEANRLLGQMPPDGMQFYELQYGPPARQRLTEAKERGDTTVLAEVATRYLHTEAGAEAALLLGTRSLLREEPLLAALYFGRLYDRRGADKLPPWTLYKIAMSFYRSGDKDGGDEVWRQLMRKIERDGGLTVDKQQVSIANLRTELDRATLDEKRVVLDWPTYRGGPSRTEQASGGSPFMEYTWTVSTMPTKADARNWIDEHLNHAQRYLHDRGLPVLPAFFPIAVNGKVVYRTYDGIYALSLKREGKLEWFSPTEGGVLTLFSDPNKKSYLDSWNQTYRQYGPYGIIYENSVTGTLSTDNTRVYAVDDLVMPPHPHLLRNFMFNQNQANLGSLSDMVNRNSLRAINLESGKLVWELGGKFDRDEPAKGLKASDLADSFFLGPPLPLGGKLYVLTEKNSELRLACLEAKDTPESPRPPEIVWTQTLALTKDKIQFDFNRRVHAASLAYGNGILVCPTNAGAVLGVDLLSHSLVWAHQYRDGAIGGNEKPNPAMNPAIRRINGMPMNINLNSEWRVSAPAIADGRVVFTAPDANAIHCLDLRDGSLLWKAQRSPDDLFFAGVFHGKVVIVGKTYVKAFNLANGKEAWLLPNIGIPSGQGTASDNVYYLPLRSGMDKEPEVCAINIETGKVVAHTKSRKKEVPGNLVFHEGEVVSQTLTAITSYPQLQKKLALIDERIKGNPNDPVGLIERGELRLDRGDLAGALSDLQTALGANPPAELLPKAREKLYETLTDMFQRDFTSAEPHLNQYRELCKNDNVDETRRRQSNFLCLLAKGREQQGRLVDAFQAYLDFVGPAAGSKELISSIDEPSTKSMPVVWARGRIAAMLDSASPEQRKPLEEKLNSEWAQVRDSNDAAALGRFAELFSPGVSVGRQARLKLAELLIEKSGPGSTEELRDAEKLLLQLVAHKDADVRTAGQAVYTLAQLMLRKGMMSDAAFYYGKLGREYPKVIIHDGKNSEKSGAELYNELITDKRFLPYLEGPRQSWNGQLKVSEVHGNFQMQPSFTLEAVGELTPFFLRHRLALDLNLQQLRVVDQFTNQDKWKTPNLPSLQYLQHGHPNIRTTYSVQGNVVVVNLGHMVYGFDPVDQKKLWEFNLYAPGTNQNPQVGQVMRDRDGNLQLLYADGWTHKLGQAGLAQASYVCLLTRNGLVALDPAKGTTLWTKSDINASRMQIFGDDQFIYLAEVNADGSVTGGSRAVRAADGVTVKVPDFAEAYGRKIAQEGRLLLVRDEANDGVKLRVYDVFSGKDLWTKNCPADTLALKSETPELGGVVDPKGNVTIYDLRARQVVLEAQVQQAHVEKLKDAYVLADRDQYYLIFNKPLDPNVANGVWLNVFHGMRCLSVNGMVYGFDRGTGKVRWFNPVSNQMLVLEQFKDLPFLFFTARSNEWVQQGNNRINQHVVAVKTIHKQSGKLLYDKRLNQNVNNFHTIVTDFKAGTVDIVSFNMKIRHTLEAKDAPAAVGAAAQPQPAVAEAPAALPPALQLQLQKQRLKDLAIREAAK